MCKFSLNSDSLACVMVLTLFVFLSACGGGGGSSTNDSNADIAMEPFATDQQLTAVNNVGGAPTTNKAPSISGRPAKSVTAGNSYSFQPSASDPDGDTLTYSIQSRPAWAEFNTRTGRLSGIPADSHSGRYKNIVVSVSDGSATVALSAFTITVSSVAVAPQTGSVSLSWLAPVTRANGDALAVNDIAGYTLRYGTSAGNYPNSININDAYTTSTTITDLSLSTYYFVITTTDTNGLESAYSSMATKVAR